MKKRWSIILLISVCFNSIVVMAQQKLPLLIRADFGSSNVKANTGKGSSTFALGIGVETVVPIVPLKRDSKLVLNPNLSYLKTGYETVVGGKVKVNYLSLGLPICYEVFGLNDANDMGFIFGAGPFINTALNGEFKVLSTDNYKAMSFGNGTADNRKRTDAGLLLKTAVRVNKLYMGLQYNIGMRNEIPKDRVNNGNYIKTRNFLFYASYAIGK
ncbi:hypothetical protein ACFOWM_07475 [Ferruginibacter yonginensis]|uniref:Outer membrane protein beta-barrel domain-containing protein n=1 Tax=Ferruginibacter yonginensis TaxID=1310416 RepID=A0ABV8QR78_9BACT